jgi:hypothetical protein
MEKNERRLDWFMRKNPLKKSQLVNTRNEMIKI